MGNSRRDSDEMRTRRYPSSRSLNFLSPFPPAWESHATLQGLGNNERLVSGMMQPNARGPVTPLPAGGGENHEAVETPCDASKHGRGRGIAILEYNFHHTKAFRRGAETLFFAKLLVWKNIYCIWTFELKYRYRDSSSSR